MEAGSKTSGCLTMLLEEHCMLFQASKGEILCASMKESSGQKRSTRYMQNYSILCENWFCN